MANLIYSTEYQELEIINKLAPEVARENKGMAFWVYKNVYHEEVSVEEMVASAKTAVFEALHEGTFESEDELLKKASKIYRSYFWGKDTEFYHSCRRRSTGKSRMLALNSIKATLPWGEDIEAPVSFIDETETDNGSIEELFSMLEDFIGTEVALMYVLKNAYGLELSKIVRFFYGFDNPAENENDYFNKYQRTYNLFKGIEEYLKGRV